MKVPLRTTERSKMCLRKRREKKKREEKGVLGFRWK